MASLSDSEGEAFLSQVERVRIELKENFSKSHQMLNEREATLLSELDELVASYIGEGVKEQIQELNRMKETLKSNVQLNGNKETVVKSVALMDNRIGELEVSLETTDARMNRVELEWCGKLEETLGEIGVIRIIGQFDYKKKGKPVMTAFKHNLYQSTEAGVFRFPSSVAIEPHFKNIYICDSGNNRVQVLSHSFEFIFQFNEKMLAPSRVSISEDKVYVTQIRSNCLNVYSIKGKLIQTVGKKGEKELEFNAPRAVEVSTIKSLIYVCDYRNNRIQCLNLNLTFNSFIFHLLGPRDIKLTQNEIVVLKGGYHCICLFNYSHQFVREMIRCGEGTLLSRPLFFCLDQQNNILMTDFSSHCVAIFSIRGEFIDKFGRKGESGGEFQCPTGIALNSDNKIVVISENPNNCLQLFSL